MFKDNRSNDRSRKTRQRQPVDQEIEYNERQEDKITRDEFIQACEDKKKEKLERKKLQQSEEQHNKRPAGTDQELVQQKTDIEKQQEYTKLLVAMENQREVEKRNREVQIQQINAHQIEKYANA